MAGAAGAERDLRWASSSRAQAAGAPLRTTLAFERVRKGATTVPRRSARRAVDDLMCSRRSSPRRSRRRGRRAAPRRKPRCATRRARATLIVCVAGRARSSARARERASTCIPSTFELAIDSVRSSRLRGVATRGCRPGWATSSRSAAFHWLAPEPLRRPAQLISPGNDGKLVGASRWGTNAS